MRLVARYVGACEAAACYAPSSRGIHAAICRRWRALFPHSTPASSCGADAWALRAPEPSTLLDDALRAMAPASPDVAHHVKARGARVTASDGALLVTRGTSSVVLPATARRPPLRVLRPEFFASHGNAVALGRSEPTRGVELRWLTLGRGGTAGWRSALVSLDGPPCGVTVRHRRRSVACVVAVYQEHTKRTSAVYVDVEDDSRGHVQRSRSIGLPFAGRAAAVHFVGDDAARVVVLYPAIRRAAVVVLDAAVVVDGCVCDPLAVFNPSSGVSVDPERRLGGLASWSSAAAGSSVSAWLYNGRGKHRTIRVASVAPEGQIRACVLRRDTVLVLRVAGDLEAHRLLGSSASVLVACFNMVAPFDAATTLTPVPGGAALLLKARSRNGGADVLYDVPLDADSEDETSGSGG